MKLKLSKITGGALSKQCNHCSNCYEAGKDDPLVRNLTRVSDTEDDVNLPAHPVREVPPTSVEEFRQELMILANEKVFGDFSCAPTIGHPFLTSKTIDEITTRINYITQESHLEDIIDDATMISQILTLVNDFFRDISVEHLSKTPINPEKTTFKNYEQSCYVSDTSSSDESELDIAIGDMSFLK